MTTIRHRFVECIPETLEPEVLYVSICHTTAVHSCCCGCGREVVTPLSPTDWKLVFDGESVSLHPSIGNWNFPCRSHYWIRNDRVEWAESWEDWQIRVVEKNDRKLKEAYFSNQESAQAHAPAETHQAEKKSFWRRALERWK